MADTGSLRSLPAYKFIAGSYPNNGRVLAVSTSSKTDWPGTPTSSAPYTTPVVGHQGSWLSTYMRLDPETTLASNGILNDTQLGWGSQNFYCPYRQFGTAYGTSGTPIRLPNMLIYDSDVASIAETTYGADSNEYPISTYYGSTGNEGDRCSQSLALVDGWLQTGTVAAGLTANNVFTCCMSRSWNAAEFLTYPFPPSGGTTVGGLNCALVDETRFIGGDLLCLRSRPCGTPANNNTYYDSSGSPRTAVIDHEGEIFERCKGRFRRLKVILYFKDGPAGADAAQLAIYQNVAAAHSSNCTLKGPYSWDTGMAATVKQDVIDFYG